MANGTIGAFSFINVPDKLDLMGQQVKKINRAGVDANAFHQLGKRADPVDVPCVADIDGFANVKTTIQGYKALEGTLVSVVSSVGNTYTNVMVQKVRVGRPKKVITPVGGLGPYDHVLPSIWTLQSTGNTA